MQANYFQTAKRIVYPDGSYWLIWTMNAELFNKNDEKVAELNFGRNYIYSFNEPEYTQDKPSNCNGKCFNTPMGIVGPYTCQHCGDRIEPMTVTCT